MSNILDELGIIDLFNEIEDPRQGWKVKHNISKIFFATICGVLCGAESWNDISDFCEAKKDWLAKYVDMSNGSPSGWTFRRVFSLIKPTEIENILVNHAKALIGGEKVEGHIAIDGKALRGSARNDIKCLQMITAWSHETGLVLAEEDIDKKSNEIKAIPILLDKLNIKDNTISIDAIACQYKIANKIIDSGGHYVLGLKGNQKVLMNLVKQELSKYIDDQEHCLSDYFEESHHRLTRRRYFSCDISNISDKLKNEWKSLSTAIAVETITTNKKTKKITSDWRYYISSHNHKNKNLPDYIKNHWGIENKLHWVLDVIMGEDVDKKCEKVSTKAFAIIKRMALNIVRNKESESDKRKKRSLRGRLKRAGWDNEYLESLLT